MTKNIIILVGGTVDPICYKSSKKIRSHSYSDDGNYYWKDSSKLIDRLKELCNEYKEEEVALFDEHGWSGKNTKINREIAGAYLANRLCGSNGEIAYYSGYRDIDVAFHLIGHSHGGNVINELTKRAATAEEWPEQWKIKSIIYLSTPFFDKKHQLNTKVLAPDCKIINVVNDYDLTQRILADFSMYDLFSAINVVNEDTPDLVKTIEKIKQTPFKDAIEGVGNIFTPLKPRKLILIPGSYKIDRINGKYVYTQTLQLLELVSQVLYEVKKIVDKLSTSLYYPSDKVSCHQNLENSTHNFIEKELEKEINKTLDNLLSDVEEIKKSVEKRNKKNDYRLIFLLRDVSPVLKRVIKYFTIDIKTGKGRITDLFYEFLNNQIEEFDITSTTPEAQLPQSFKSNLVNTDITELDKYHSQGNLENFEYFIKQLELAEKNYQNKDDEECDAQRELLSICIKLIAPQIEFKIFKAELKKIIQVLDKNLNGNMVKLLSILPIKIKPVIKVAYSLQTLLKDYDKLLDKFSIELSNSEKQTSIKHSENEVITGSLKHFSLVSHSMSRECLYPEVEKHLISQFETSKVYDKV